MAKQENLTLLQPWEQSFAGVYWWEMPGQDTEVQKINFALFRRGLIKVEEAAVEVSRGDGGGTVSTSVLVSVHRAKIHGGVDVRSRPSQDRARVILAKVGLREARVGLQRKAEAVVGGAPMARRKPTLLSARHEALIAEYQRLTAAMPMDMRPSQLMRDAAERMGMASRRVRSGLDRRTRWTDAECAVLEAALESLKAVPAEVAALRERVMDLFAQWVVPGSRGALKDIMAKCDVSRVTLHRLQDGKSKLGLETLRQIERGLVACLATGRQEQRRQRVATRGEAE
jgi:hypothetical protein